MNVQKKLKKDNKKIQFLNIVQLKSVTVKEETKTEKIKPIKKKKKNQSNSICFRSASNFLVCGLAVVGAQL